MVSAGVHGLHSERAQLLQVLASQVGTTATSTTVTASPSPAVSGQTVTITATVSSSTGSGTPTGTVTFTNGSTTLGTAPVESNGTATFSTFRTSTLPVGNDTVTASYGGDVTYDTSSGSVAETVTSAGTTATTTTVSSSLNPASSGTSVTFTATVAHATGSATPTGTVTFSEGSTTLGTATLESTGTATFNTSTLAVGSDTVTASYSGDATYASSSNSVTESVTSIGTTTTAVTASANPAVSGQTVTFTATVTAGSGTFDNGGTVQFAVDGTNFGSPVSLSGGQATIADSALAAGTHTITATYSGDTNFSTSSGTLSGGQTVNHGGPRRPTVTSSANPSAFGQSGDLHGHGDGRLGDVRQRRHGAVRGGRDELRFPVSLSGGQATIADAALAAGTHTITATYSGDTNFSTSSGTLSGGQTVTRRARTTTA